MGSSKLLLVIPFYNEALRIEQDKFSAAFNSSDTDFLLVDDCSTDTTLEILNHLASGAGNVQVFSLSINMGKGGAIREGVLHAARNSYSYIGYLDADLATPIEELWAITAFAEINPQFNFFMGSRIQRLGSAITRYAYRHYSGRIFATVVSQNVIKAPVYDTQCGAKILKSALAVQLFQDPFKTKWLFDIELLLRYKKLDPQYITKVYEYPLSIWTEKGNSKLSLSDLITLPLQLLKIYRDYV